MNFAKSLFPNRREQTNHILTREVERVERDCTPNGKNI